MAGQQPAIDRSVRLVSGRLDPKEGPRRFWGRRGPLMSGRYDHAMLESRSQPSLTRPMRRPPVMLAVVVVALLAVGACTPANPTASASATAEPTSRPTPSPVPAASESTPGLPTQTDTAWGRIWDAIPPSFPVPAGAVPTIVSSEPASATLEVPASSGNVSGIAHFFADALDRDGEVVGLEGPLEDGSFIVVVGTHASPCQMQVTIAPLGATTVATILYGAGCPFE
jgi:hypothetical protein